MNSDSAKHILLWFSVGSSEPSPVDLGQAALLAPGISPSFGTTGGAATDVKLQPVDEADGVIAVVYVGEAVDYHIALNGTPLTNGGMYSLKPTDRLDISNDSYWLSQDLSPRRTTYSPDQHGAEARCSMTKARLIEDQEIVVCPGRPCKPCNVIYRADAWGALTQSTHDVKCPACGYRPGQPAWRPQIRPRNRKPLHDYSQFNRRESAD